MIAANSDLGSKAFVAANYRRFKNLFHSKNEKKAKVINITQRLKEFNPPPADKCLNSKNERIGLYRKYVYEAEALSQTEKSSSKVIEDTVLRKERRREFVLSRSDRFRYLRGRGFFSRLKTPRSLNNLTADICGSNLLGKRV